MSTPLADKPPLIRIEMPARLEGPQVQQIEREIIGYVRAGQQVELDLSQTTELSSFGVRMLLLVCRALSSQPSGLSVIGLSQQLVDTLDAVGFHLSAHRPTRRDLDEARAGWQLLHRIDIEPSMHISGYAVRQGSPLFYGARPIAGGVNFCISSAHATSCTLVLFERDKNAPIAELPFPDEFKIGNVFTMFVFGLDADLHEYGYRFSGPFEPKQGQRFDWSKVLLDPFAVLVTGRDAWGLRSEDSIPYRCRVAPPDFDWEQDSPPSIPMEDLVIYEMHVRGFTRASSSEVRWPGTFAGVREKIPYLKSLGVNCIELMPIFEFDELDNPRHNPKTGEPLVNYWGYNTVAFFAPKAGYAATGPLGMQSDEFKALVKDLHANGIEVILDVVFNHTAEGNEEGPTLSFRGIDNKTYYILGPNGEYLNYSGTGNTLNCNHPIVREMVRECLRHWVAHYHIDGFRFDLASILGRSLDGEPLANPPLLESLAHDPILAHCKLIAEAWDAAGLYQVGSFPSYGRWAEWNGRFRDCVRRFMKGDQGQVAEVAKRIMGSPDLYADRGPSASVNYVTCHDGFTLMDLVSYDEKHNEANGEDNRDGNEQNDSWNHGVEGPTLDVTINALRQRQMKNAFAMLLVSQGVPMILMGDEVGRTQNGNNNAYCHDGELTWLDWKLHESNSELFRFCQRMIAFRKAHPALRHSLHTGEGFTHTNPLEVTWHGVSPFCPDWSFDSHSIAFMLRMADETKDTLYVILNMYWKSLAFVLPSPPAGQRWCLFANTGLESPNDIAEPGKEKPLSDGRSVVAAARTVILLVAR